MIIWSGFGVLLPIVFGFGFLLPLILHPYLTKLGISLPGDWQLALGCVLGTLLSWLLSSTIAKTKVKTLLDPQTNRPVHLKSTHTLFFIPVRFYCWLGIALSIFLVGAAATGNLKEFRSRNSDSSNSVASAPSTPAPNSRKGVPFTEDHKLPIMAFTNGPLAIYSETGIERIPQNSQIKILEADDAYYTIEWKARKYTAAKKDMFTAVMIQ